MSDKEDKGLKTIKTRREILSMMREGAIVEEYQLEIGLKIKRRFMIAMPSTDNDLRTKISSQIAKEEHQLEQQQQVVKIIEELIADQERGAIKS